VSVLSSFELHVPSCQSFPKWLSLFIYLLSGFPRLEGWLDADLKLSDLVGYVNPTLLVGIEIVFLTLLVR